MKLNPADFGIFSAILFCVGLGGGLVRRSPSGQLLGLGLMFAASVVALAGFSQSQGGGVATNTGTVVALVVATVAAVLIATSLCLQVLVSRQRHDAAADSTENAT